MLDDHKTACLTVRDFIGQFRGLSGTAKQNAICTEIGVAERETLADFYARSPPTSGGCSAAMQAASRPVKPRDLGVIGADASSGAAGRGRLRLRTASST